MGEIADEDELRAFAEASDLERKLTPQLRGVLAEIATMGLIRYPWDKLQPLIVFLLHQVLQEYDSLSKVEVGPAQPLPNGESTSDLSARLTTALQAYEDNPPFTLQRLAELLLEPQKQYSRLDKLALALEKLLLVTSTVEPAKEPPPRPTIESLPPVNENPKPPAGSALPATIRPTGASPRAGSNGLHFPGSGFNLANAALGTLTAGAASQFMPGTQSPAAMTADIDRLGDSGPQKLISPPTGNHAPHILDASLSSQGIAHPAGTS